MSRISSRHCVIIKFILVKIISLKVYRYYSSNYCAYYASITSFELQIHKTINEIRKRNGTVTTFDK